MPPAALVMIGMIVRGVHSSKKPSFFIRFPSALLREDISTNISDAALNSMEKR